MTNSTELDRIGAEHGVVGRRPALRALDACLRIGRNALMEGPVGVGKTVLARAVCAASGRGFIRVDGDGRYTEAKLVGHFDPPGVLARGYQPDLFIAGPLVSAMQQGAVLFINELNRMPEGVQNVLLPALDEGVVHVPHLGAVHAVSGFSVVATQNPAEFVATGQLSEALLDRFELVVLDYQSAEEEVQIVQRQATTAPAADLVQRAVALTRETRSSKLFRRGASVRAAVAIADLATVLGGDILAAAVLALPTRVELMDGRDQDLTVLLTDLLQKADEALARETLEKKAPAELTKQPRGQGRQQLSAEPRQGGEGDAVAAPPTQAVLDELPKDWEAATHFHKLRGRLPSAVRRIAEERAIDAILDRARQILRHASRPTHRVNDHFPADGELDLEATLDQPRPWLPTDIILERVDPREADVVLILDMSLSMTGEKIALTAVAAAIMKIKLESVAVVQFDTTAHTLVRVGESVPVRELVRRILTVPAQGYTNIEAGLEEGLTVLRRARRPERVGVILTDGIANMGWDPVRVAVRYPRLHVVQLGNRDRHGGATCRRMARSGRGRRFETVIYAQLPEVMRKLIRDCFEH